MHSNFDSFKNSEEMSVVAKAVSYNVNGFEKPQHKRTGIDKLQCLCSLSSSCQITAQKFDIKLLL